MTGWVDGEVASVTYQLDIRKFRLQTGANGDKFPDKYACYTLNSDGDKVRARDVVFNGGGGGYAAYSASRFDSNEDVWDVVYVQTRKMSGRGLIFTIFTMFHLTP